jgi:hypothetical protein
VRTVSRILARVAATVLVAAACAALPTPAQAATCASSGGVSVVVDFHELGGGVRTACLPDGGGDRASDLFPAAGFPLEYVQRQPGFVCRVSGVPADNPCVSTPPANAYWSLWWSDGESGAWTYATSGASGLTVPDGGYVGFSWQGSSSRTPPGVAPSAHPDPEPTQQPSAHPTKQPSAQPSSSSSSSQPPSPGQQQSTGASASPSGPGSASGKPSVKPRGQRSAAASASASASPSPGEAEDSVAPTSAEPSDPGDGGLPPWVAPVVVLVLFGAAGGVAVVRRRRAGAS